jgi:hypothetical protein
MKLIKVKDGLLESDNFFLASPFSDFAGEANITRDISTGRLKIISDTKIERPFTYSEFVIEVKKVNSEMASDDYAIVYLNNGLATFGIKDSPMTEQNTYWKILKKENYIQAYSSSDGINYTNIGGMSIEGSLIKQGFMKHGSDFIIEDYKVYDNPYVTLQNFDEGYTCELYDSQDNLLKTRTFDSNMECKLFLDYNSFEGYFKFKDLDNNIVYTSDNIILGYGDIWIISPYNFEIIYLGNIVTNINPAALKDLDEAIIIKNVGSSDYSSITVGTQTSSNDLIQLSLDGINYSDTLNLSINQSEEKTIYIKITKNIDNHNFNVRDFQVVITE